MASNNSTAKTHVSLRLPTYLLESIDAHAEKESISRTEAFVHYLQTGLEISDEKANEPSADEALLQNIQSELAEIKAMLKASGASVPAAAVADDEDIMVPVSFTSEEEEEDEVEVEDEFSTSDAVYEGVVEAEANEEDTDFSEGAEDENAAMFDASDAVISPDEMPVEEVAPATPASNVFSPDYQPAAVVETVEVEDVEEDDEPMETLSDYYEEAAAEEEAEDDFSGSDAVEEDVVEDNPYVSSSYFSSTTEEDEAEAEEEAEMFSDSDAVFENDFEDASDEDEEDDYTDDDYADDDDDEFEEEVEEFDASDEVIDVEEVEENGNFDTEDDQDEDEFTDSDEVFEAEETADNEDELDIDEVVYVEPLALSDLEDAVNLVAQQFPMIEKVWLFGNAATGGAITQETIDLCVKAEKFKSKYADLFISMIQDNTGKTVNVVLRNDMEKSVKQIWKATRIDLYRA